MSHVATIDIEVKDLDALAAACTRLGLHLVRDQKTYRWYGQHVGDYPVPEGFTQQDLGRCEHAIRIPDTDQLYKERASKGRDLPYEIGIVSRRDGQPGYTLLWDFYAGGCGMQSKVGKNCTLLKQSYATEVAKRAAMRQGFQVAEKILANGSIQLVCS